MRSIRLSLTVCFLVLLAGALGVASLLVYENALQTHQARRESRTQLIEAHYKDRCREEERDLDEQLRFQAQTLARLIQFQIDDRSAPERGARLLGGLLTSALTPGGQLLAPWWLAQAEDGPWDFDRGQTPYASVRLNDRDLLEHVDGQIAEYFQVDTAWGSSYHSHKLGLRSFPLDPRAFAPREALHWQFDDIRLGSGVRVRRVVLKTPAARLVPFRGLERWRPDMPRPGVGEVPVPERVLGSGWLPRPSIYIQCACDTRKRDEELAGFHRDRDEALADLEQNTTASLSRLRWRLLAIATITFAAAMMVSFWLVRLGLAPLRRLSDAVSRVSPRDLHFRLDQTHLPEELRPIVERLQTTFDLLQRAFAREKQAAADISHELRTPLAALLTTTELALRKPRAAEHYRELLEDCRLSAVQMNQIVERLLTLARLDAGVDALRLRAVDVGVLAEQCAAVVRPLAEARSLSLRVRNDCAPPFGDPSPGQLLTDPDKVREVLTNLLHNAIQYNQPQGSVELRVTRDNGTLELEVADTGIGISPAAREHIFERFYRADPSRGGDSLHSGLGLAIVKEYVDLMGGTIEVRSTEGQGSTFRVRLPAAPPVSERRGLPPPGGSP